MKTRKNALALTAALLCGTVSAQIALGGAGSYELRRMPVLQPDGSVVMQQVAVPVQTVAPVRAAPPPPPRRDDWDRHDDWDHRDRHKHRDRRDVRDGHRDHRDRRDVRDDRDDRDGHRDRRDDRDVRDDRDGHRDRRAGRSGASLPKGYSRVGSYTAGGSAKETGGPSSRPIRKVRIVATSGSVIVNTVVVREGGAKTPHTLAVRLAAGESREIDLGSARRVTGLRISDGGKGTYEIQVR